MRGNLPSCLWCAMHEARFAVVVAARSLPRINTWICLLHTPATTGTVAPQYRPRARHWGFSVVVLDHAKRFAARRALGNLARDQSTLAQVPLRFATRFPPATRKNR